MPDELKILIAEDDHFLSFLLRGRLEKEHVRVLQATDGQEVMNLLKTDRPDVIILDLIMPKVSGFEVLELMSIDPELAKIPVIILSNLGQDEDIEKAKRLGAVAYFVKARASIDEIIRAIKQYVPVPAS